MSSTIRIIAIMFIPVGFCEESTAAPALSVADRKRSPLHGCSTLSLRCWCGCIDAIVTSYCDVFRDNWARKRATSSRIEEEVTSSSLRLGRLPSSSRILSSTPSPERRTTRMDRFKESLQVFFASASHSNISEVASVVVRFATKQADFDVESNDLPYDLCCFLTVLFITVN